MLYIMCVCVQLTTHASTQDQSFIETPVKLTIKVIDQNDNKPLCIQDPFMGEVPERAKQSRIGDYSILLRLYICLT